MEDLRRIYLHWLKNQLRTNFEMGDPLALKDPDREGTRAYDLVQRATNLLSEYPPMTWDEVASSLPLISEFNDYLYAQQRTEEDELPEWAQNGRVVVPGKLIALPDGSHVDYNGIRVDPNTALQMIHEWMGTKTDDTLTAFEEESLNLALKELAWEMEKYGTLSAADKAGLQVAMAELGQRRNEWLAGLQAQPADWIERWYAEHLPVGTEMGETPWGTAPVGSEEWMQQYEGGTATPTAPPVGGTSPAGGVPSGWQPSGTSQGISPASMGEGGYNFPSYQEHMSAYPNDPISPEMYYSQAGAYELAAQTNPAFARGAQQAQIALQVGEITPQEYQSIKAANFVDAQGNPLAPQTKSQIMAKEVAGGWAQAQSPAGYVGQLQAQGIPASSWVSGLSPQASPAMQSYVGQAQQSIQAPLPGGDWASYAKGGAQHAMGSPGGVYGGGFSVPASAWGLAGITSW